MKELLVNFIKNKKLESSENPKYYHTMATDLIDSGIGEGSGRFW